jgi:hypothetical protein
MPTDDLDAFRAVAARHFYTPLQKRVVDLLGGGPLKAAAVAKRLGVPLGHRLRCDLASLVSRGIARVTPEGYGLVDKVFLLPLRVSE